MELNDESKVALKIAHLNMIQGIIARMSGFSASAKTFTVTILAGLAAISLQADKAQLGLIAMLVTIVLGVIDVYYLTLELRFRALYEHVESRNLDRADDLDIKPLTRSGDVKRALNSTSTKLFYLPVFGACALFIGYGLVHDWWTVTDRLSGSDASRAGQPADAIPPISIERTRQRVQPTTNQTAGAVGQLSGRPPPTGTRGPLSSESKVRSATR